MSIFTPEIFVPEIFISGATTSTGIRVEIITQDVSISLAWRSWTIQESIGQPDTLSVELVAINDTIIDTIGNGDNYFYIQVYKDGDYLDNGILFSGLVQKILRRNNHRVITYTLQAVGWEFLAPKRLVGAPAGQLYLIQGEDETDRLPTGVAIDPSATGSPTAAAVQALFAAYWTYPPIDTVTYVNEILPEGATVEEINWSGSDLDGAMNDICAAGSAAAMWYIANDSPDPQNITAPYLALHVDLFSLPDEGDDGGGLMLGLGSGDEPTNVAPYAISDTPDWIDSIMASAVPELEIGHDQHLSSVYVRGATGFTLEVVAAPVGFPVPYQIGNVIEGGTGFVGNADGGIWGAAYVDAPAAVTPAQRNAFGSAYLEAHAIATVSGTILIDSGYDGWHKGQAVQVTDAGLGLDARWLLIRSVSIKANDPQGEALSYGLTVGDTLTAQLGYALRQQRLKEARKEVAPATRFIPYVGDLTLAPGDTTPLTFQLATDAGKAMPAAGVGAVWHLLLNGADVPDVEDTGIAFYLTDLILVTDDKGQVTATLNAGAGALASDAVRPWVAMVP